MCIHAGNCAFAFVARIPDLRHAHEPILYLRIAAPKLLAHGIGLIEEAFFDESEDAARELVEIGLEEREPR